MLGSSSAPEAGARHGREERRELGLGRRSILSLFRRRAHAAFTTLFVGLAPRGRGARSGPPERAMAPRRQHVHLVGDDVVEQPLIMRYDQETTLRRAHVVHSVGRRVSRHRYRARSRFRRGSQNAGSSIASCNISLRFFSPPEKADIERALQHILVDIQVLSDRAYCASEMRPASICGSPRPPWLAHSRLCAGSSFVVTPGISTGYCIASKMPCAARSSALSANKIGGRDR